MGISNEKIRKRSGREDEDEDEEDERSRADRERKKRRKLTSRRGAEAWMRYWLPGLHVLSE